MKSVFFAALLLSFALACYAQQPLCFSTHCPQTPAATFAPRHISPQLNYMFRPAPLLPLYQPVAPLKFSTASRQFFQPSAPALPMGAKVPAPGAALSKPNASSHASGTRNLNGLHSSTSTGTGFSSGAGGISFAPPHR